MSGHAFVFYAHHLPLMFDWIIYKWKLILMSNMGISIFKDGN